MRKIRKASSILACVFTAMFCHHVRGEAKEITDPKFYSAGKTSASEIDAWMRKEIPPETCDIWGGKKERINLSGSWKIMKLAGTASNSEDNFGEKHGFANRDCNDSSWFNQPVPWMWNLPFPDGKKSDLDFAGVGWYRKHIKIPDSLKGKRLILHFEAVDDSCQVFVNGKKVAEHKVVSLDSPLSYGARGAECFSADITDSVIFGANNVIALKVYDDGKHFAPWHPKERGVGGIWQEVYIDVLPEIYSLKTLISPDINKSGVLCKSFVNNTTGKTVSADLSVKLSPWKSARYKFAKFPDQTVSAGKFELKPGENEISYFIKIKDPAFWSPEKPNLYRFELLDGKLGAIGQERFGFREVKVGKREIFINNIPTNMRCEQCVWRSWSSAPGYEHVNRLGYMNRGNIIEKWFKNARSVNLNMARTHTTQEPHSYLDIADEVGFLVYPEIPVLLKVPDWEKNVFDGKNLLPFAKEKIKTNVFEAYNNPSVIMRSCGNEMYDQDLYDCKKLKTYKDYLSQALAEYKKLDITRPVTSSSGRCATEKSCDKIGTRAYGLSFDYIKSDFHDIHNYQMTWDGLIFAEYDSWPSSYKKHYDALLLDDGAEKAVFNGETFISSLIGPWHGGQKTLVKYFIPHIKNGVFDRKWFVDNCQIVPPRIQDLLKGEVAFATAAQKFGYVNSILPEKSKLIHARFLKDFIEQTRRKRDYCAGYAANASQLFAGRTADCKLNEPIASYAKTGNQPAIACLGLKFNKNMFAGQKNPEETVYIINDHEYPLNNIEIKIFAQNEKSGKKILFPSVKAAMAKAGQMLEKPCSFQFPDNADSGNYRLTLEFFADGKKEGENFYENIYVLNVKDVRLKNAELAKGKKIGIFVPGGAKDSKGVKDLAKILNALNILSANFADLKDVKNFDIVIIPPDAWSKDIEASALSEWLKGGGKLVCFEQKTQVKGLPGMIQSAGTYGWTVEPIVPAHPIFTGLKQENFTLWNGAPDNPEGKWLVHYAVMPLNYGVLASFVSVGKRSVMAAADMKINKGSCLQSQFIAAERFMKDSVATRLLVNIFDYTLGAWNKAEAPGSNGSDSGQYKINKKKAFFVDLRPYANMGFKDDVAGDRKGGWTDQGPQNDFRNLPLGKQEFLDVPFDIIDPASNNGKSCIVLQGNSKTKTDFLPDKCQKIMVDKKVSKLFFLVSGAWIPRKPLKQTMGKIQIVYTAMGRGTFATQNIPLITGKNIKDWWNPASGGSLSDAALAWVGRTESSKDKINEVGVYIFEWVNPDTNRKVLYINFYSARKGIPALLAVTGEEL